MKTLKLAFMFLLGVCLVSSCDSFKDSDVYTTEELEKHLDGTWSIAKASRNEVDITRLMDFSQFKLTFKADNTYTIENYLPFLVREDGQWSINDIKYPSQITFKSGTNSKENISAIQYQIVKGERQLVLTFTPGYHANSYTYVFERIAEPNN